MRRFRKLIQKILEYAESNATDQDLPIPEFQEYPQPLVDYHVELCVEAGFLVVTESTNQLKPLEPGIAIRRLTWAGHDELERLRPNTD